MDVFKNPSIFGGTKFSSHSKWEAVSDCEEEEEIEVAGCLFPVLGAEFDEKNGCSAFSIAPFSNKSTGGDAPGAVPLGSLVAQPQGKCPGQGPTRKVSQKTTS